MNKEPHANEQSVKPNIRTPSETELEQVETTLKEAEAAIWDSHYGKGLSVEYARCVTDKIKTALSALKQVNKEKNLAVAQNVEPTSEKRADSGDRDAQLAAAIASNNALQLINEKRRVELRELLLERGLDSDAVTAKIEEKIKIHLREHPLRCPFPSCVSKFANENEPSSVRVEELGGGWVAECQNCCGGTGTLHTPEAAIDEWNGLPRRVPGLQSSLATKPLAGHSTAEGETLPRTSEGVLREAEDRGQVAIIVRRALQAEGLTIEKNVEVAVSEWNHYVEGDKREVQKEEKKALE